MLIDHYWIQAVPPHSLVTLDISDTGAPREVARLELAEQDSPHWISREPEGRRIAVTGRGGLLGRILIGRVGTDGHVELDPDFVDPSGKPGIRLEGVPHGVVFSRP